MTDYIQAVTQLLGRLTADERADVVNYYQEYLMDAGIQTYDDAVSELGVPRSLARKVLADYSIKLSDQVTAEGDSRTKDKQAKTNVRMVWLIILALLSTPVTIPILLIILLLLLAFGCVTFGLIVAAGATYLSLIVAGVITLFAGIATLLAAPWTGIFYLGMGLTILGTSWLVWLLIKWVGRWLIWGLSWFAKKIYHRFMPRNRAERGRTL
ncbi:hypothetical protein FD13_GL001842 [Levilactobacillus senmaizukei DSM 21775 = NBRC 103853]|uniref:Integral membrane protein n=1 Tax=Levilactobacillus senmaizukei DSM 21775 = NBRC 103853 TaxID=1423803 RepID=A0A0R2DF86_9LACO|nr:DUF1700 domain-containing protein [Levilactobacillus senmaizukei]KRN02617.1 hypothetical protein FD13_GL001842 [Levilactobacillus senmaizukei DSM 21775 = NBRC 103853]